MVAATLPDIPRLYTGMAEWAACFIYILILKKRLSGWRLSAALVGGLAALCGIQLVNGRLPLSLWIPGMVVAVVAMFALIWLCCDLSLKDTGYTCVRAFVLAEFSASLSWQLYGFFFQVETDATTLHGLLFALAVYAAVYIAAYFAEARHMESQGALHVKTNELWAAVFIAAMVFLISNISFVTQNTPFSSRLVPELFYIRTLVNFCGLLVLYIYQEQRRESQLTSELKSIENILKRQFEQYKHSKEAIELINYKYHDIKHQVGVIRAEQDSSKRATYLEEMEAGLEGYEAQHKTGNKIIDTILTSKSLTCQQKGITLTSVADGALLDFMDTIDISTIFGNALDNAIESAVKLPDEKKRLVRVALYAHNNFIVIRFENYFEGTVKMEDGLPKTTKKDNAYHGFGLKSIRHTAEKYGGTITIATEDNWFTVRVLIPSPQ